jgi:ATP-dependent helicase/nuclease subunit B
MDQLQTDQVPLHQLNDLVVEEFADHWQITIDFLQIIGEQWPLILKARGVMDPVDRRNQLLAALVDHWSNRPPPGPVIAAGSTGSIPATAQLLKTIGNLPQGQVILPGFDQALDEESWQALDPSHPQAGMQQLLDRMEAKREQVRVWPSLTDGDQDAPRDGLLREAMRPAQTTQEWRHLDKEVISSALSDLHRIDANTTREEAGSIALIMRQTLEDPGKTAALITPDRELARRTAAALRRWDIEIDDSAGLPLSGTPVATFLRLIADMVQEQFAPVSLLAVLKHPYCAQGLSPATFRQYSRKMELAVLRGPRPAGGTDGVSHALRQGDCPDELTDWWQDFTQACQALLGLFSQPHCELGAMAQAHIVLAEALATTDTQTGADVLWRGQAGESLASFFEDLLAHADLLGDIPSHNYPSLIDAALVGQSIRPQWGRHPRLSILGPLEARLHHADVTILGGLNEGSWPPDPGSDPWLNRPMRQQVGLPLPERRIGLSAHDFVHGASAGKVYLTRATRSGGAPTMPSRWLLRLDAVTEGLPWQRPDYAVWAKMLDQAGPPRPTTPPEPRPSLELRPSQLSATQIETWMRDPYAIYANKILVLRVLPPLDENPGARDQGNFVHQALEDYTNAYPDALPDNAREEILRCGQQAFGAVEDRPGVHSFWWPRFVQIADWFLDQQAARLGTVTPALIEKTGHMVLEPVPGHPFTITAKADRIDRRDDGSFEIIDYKTGTPPKALQVDAGYAPQLPIEALILNAGGFPGITDAETSDLAYWHLRGGSSGSRIDAFSNRRKQKDLPTLLAEAEDGLVKLISAFALEDTPYLSHPNPAEKGWGDYDHLARVKEWESLRDDS